MKYAVISYSLEQYEMPNVWLYETEEEAKEALKRLYKKAYDEALKDDNFEADECYLNDVTGMLSWGEDYKCCFEFANITTEEDI